jgi:hypothetical protein
MILPRPPRIFTHIGNNVTPPQYGKVNEDTQFLLLIKHFNSVCEFIFFRFLSYDAAKQPLRVKQWLQLTYRTPLSS